MCSMQKKLATRSGSWIEISWIPNIPIREKNAASPPNIPTTSFLTNLKNFKKVAITSVSMTANEASTLTKEIFMFLRSRGSSNCASNANTTDVQNLSEVMKKDRENRENGHLTMELCFSVFTLKKRSQTSENTWWELTSRFLDKNVWFVTNGEVDQFSIRI